jgi:omega-hydroxy-beta-dihydromenaquinone-9 sulfotransferase
MSQPALTNPPRPQPKTAGRTWAPRFWEGCDYFAFWRMMVANRFAVQPPYWYIAAILSITTFVNTVLRWLQHGMYGRAIAEMKITHPPIFVLGHWRTGTTLLHELLVLDDRHTSPTTLQCFEPCHFLLSEGVLKQYGKIFLPDKRPMDNMVAGWDRPQEDEFALALLGQPSTYTDFAFPARPPMWPGALDLSGLTDRQRRDWKRVFLNFLKAITLRDPRRLVLKSPPHTARIRALLEMFPDAKFVHIVRNPYTLFASTVNLWLSLGKAHGLQTPHRAPELEEKVFREFRTIADRYEEGRKLIPPGNLVEVRYEDLVKDLVVGTKAVYDGLGLDGWEVVLPKVEAFAAGQKSYETNKYTLTDDQRAKITERWGDVIRKQGYGG